MTQLHKGRQWPRIDKIDWSALEPFTQMQPRWIRAKPIAGFGSKPIDLFLQAQPAVTSQAVGGGPGVFSYIFTYPPYTTDPITMVLITQISSGVEQYTFTVVGSIGAATASVRQWKVQPDDFGFGYSWEFKTPTLSLDFQPSLWDGMSRYEWPAAKWGEFP